MDTHDTTCSARPDGRRLVWDLIWKNNALAKVRIFAWKAARDYLDTQATKKYRHKEEDNTCTLCGMEEENTHHALIRSPHAVGLWQAMHETWELPTQEMLRDAEPDWIFRLLGNLTETQKLASLMIMWRIWYARNEITHHKPPVPFEASRWFLTSYIISLIAIKQYLEVELVKAK